MARFENDENNGIINKNNKEYNFPFEFDLE
jgi:hypothetical protein